MQELLIALEDVGQDHGVEVTNMRGGIDVKDRGCHIIWLVKVGCS